MRMPTRLGNGEGRVSGEAIDTSTRLDPPGYGARHVGRVMWVSGGDPSRRGLAVLIDFERTTGHQHPGWDTVLHNYRSLLAAQGRSRAETRSAIAVLRGGRSDE